MWGSIEPLLSIIRNRCDFDWFLIDLDKSYVFLTKTLIETLTKPSETIENLRSPFSKGFDASICKNQILYLFNEIMNNVLWFPLLSFYYYF